MSVAVRENHRLDAAGAGRQRVGDLGRRSERQDALAILEPGPIQHWIPGRLKCPLVAPEPDFVGSFCCTRTSRAKALEIQAELVPNTRAERPGELIARSLLEVLRGRRSMHWKDDPNRPCTEAGNHRSVTLKE